jgi:hypothetical protein
MGVYNLKMEMPDGCAYCSIWKNCNIIAEKIKEWDGNDQGFWLPWNYRHMGCPLVEIPTPHSRLIEENDLEILDPCFGTEEWIHDLMLTHDLDYLHGIDEDQIKAFAMDICEGFLNIVRTASTVIEEEY